MSCGRALARFRPISESRRAARATDRALWLDSLPVCGEAPGFIVSQPGESQPCTGRNSLVARWALGILIAVMIVSPAAAHEDGGPVDEIRVRAGAATTATAALTVEATDFELRPLESTGQLLETVPGVLTAQHTGGGKAEQYFLRGFDADHGTDLAVSFDGVPINLRGHAHGQGYLDLHFIPIDAVERVEVSKGPYSPRAGDFATAGAIDFVTFHELPRSRLRVEAGPWDTWRVGAVGSPGSGIGGDASRTRSLAAFEVAHTDGPLRSDEDLWRYSALLRGDTELGGGWSASGHLVAYLADWNASGLVPDRLVRTGELSRWGSLDASEGGETSRLQAKVQLEWEAAGHARLTLNAYLARYGLDLHSNFTYALGDPAGGDGIVQRDDRLYGGGHLAIEHVLGVGFPATLRGGIDWRVDDARVRLGRQTGGTDTRTDSDDDLRVGSIAPYLEVVATPLPWIRFEGGLRHERVRFDVESRIGGPGGSGTDALWLPKSNLVLSPFADGGPWPSAHRALRELQLFLHAGTGFHSNDPRSGVSDERILTLARGAELGVRTRLASRAEVAASVFWLSLDDELLFVGDEGTTESAGASRRLGLELAMRLGLAEWLELRADVAYTSARAASGPIPQAPRLVAKASLVAEQGPWRAEIAARMLGERHAVDASPGIRLSDYAVVDLGLRYRHDPWEIGLRVENLTDREWRSSEFFYASCAPSEVGQSAACPVTGGGTGFADFHFTPGNRRHWILWARWRF